MTTFLDMGGYGWYVWMAYGVTALVIVVEIMMLRSRRRLMLIEARLAEPEMPITTRATLDPGSLS